MSLPLSDSSFWAIEVSAGRSLLLTYGELAAASHAPGPKAVERFDSRHNGSSGILTFNTSQRQAVIRLVGIVLPRHSMLSQVIQSTVLADVAEALDLALTNPSIEHILLDVDSPGGAIAGVHETANAIRRANAVKPVTAYVSNMAASAAYWLTSAAGRIVADRTATIGSIGIVLTAFRATDTNTIEFVSSQSPYKRLDPTNDVHQAILQKRVDELAAIFIECVAEHRGMTESKVLADFGQGSMVIADRARAAGMIDAVGCQRDASLSGSAGTRQLTVGADSETGRPIPTGSAHRLESFEESCRREFASNDALKHEFAGEVENYIAYRRYETGRRFDRN